MRTISAIGISLLLAFLFSSCSSKKEHISSAKVPAAQPDVVVFMVYHIERDSAGLTRLKLVSTVPAEGKLKPESLNNPVTANRLVVEVYEHSKLLSIQNLEHPLYKDVEVADGNVLSRRSVTISQADFFFRIQKPQGEGLLKIKEIIQDKPAVELQTIKF